MSKSNFVKELNASLALFCGKHPQNIQLWTDGDKTIIQLNNIGIRDKLFYRLEDLIKNTTLEDELELFNMPVKCVYASGSVLRFVGKSKEVLEFMKNNEISVESVPTVVIPTAKLESIVKKVTDRVVKSKTFVKIETVVEKEKDKEDDSNKIKIYVVTDPTSVYDHEASVANNEPQNYITWKVVGILKIDAGTTWNDENLQKQIYELVRNVQRNHSAEYGSINVNLEPKYAGDKNVYDTSVDEDQPIIGRMPEFTFDENVKVGDIIKSYEYHAPNLFDSGWNYQTDIDNYQHQTWNEETNDWIIMDGTIITY